MNVYYCEKCEYYMVKCPPFYLKIRRLPTEPISKTIYRYFGEDHFYRWLGRTIRGYVIFRIHRPAEVGRFYIFQPITKEEFYEEHSGI